mgnify:CR=1 FL=1
MNSCVTIACVLSPGPLYTSWHVDRLKDMVAQHMSQPYQFVCVDDSKFPGWWAKIDLFKPGRFTGRVLYLDLDSTVIGSLDDIANHKHPSLFSMMENFKEFKEPNKARLNSSVMAWDAEKANHLFTEFTPSVMERLNGDQNWISEQMPDAATFPEDLCVSYKVRRAKLKTIPKDARVVCYHGNPKPWDLPSDHLEGFTFV